MTTGMRSWRKTQMITIYSAMSYSTEAKIKTTFLLQKQKCTNLSERPLMPRIMHAWTRSAVFVIAEQSRRPVSNTTGQHKLVTVQQLRSLASADVLGLPDMKAGSNGWNVSLWLMSKIDIIKWICEIVRPKGKGHISIYISLFCQVILK